VGARFVAGTYPFSRTKTSPLRSPTRLGRVDGWRAYRLAGSQAESEQKFSSVHAQVHNLFNLERHLVTRHVYKQRRSAASAEWYALVA
jgi:hypothetical protein